MTVTSGVTAAVTAAVIIRKTQKVQSKKVRGNDVAGDNLDSLTMGSKLETRPTRLARISHRAGLPGGGDRVAT